LTARSTYAVVHDIDGPKVRLGVLWFAVTAGACIVSRPAFALLLAVAAALAADQVVRLNDPLCATGAASGLQRAQRLLADPARLVAVLGAGALPLAAAAGSDTLAGAIAAATMVGLAAAGSRAIVPLFASFQLGLAAASPVLLHRLGTGAALALLLLIAAYDAGDFIVGSGGGTTWEGPVAGITAVAVVGFAVVVAQPTPLQEDGAAALALLVGMLAPLGPLLASMLIGSGSGRARYVRRLDSLLVAGPISAYALAALLPRL